MKHAFFAAAALATLSVIPASAQMAPRSSAAAPAQGQMMADPMMPMGAQSCVMNGQFVPCPPGGGMRPEAMAPNPFAVPGMVAGAAVGTAAGVAAGTAAGVGAGMAAGAAAADPASERRMTAAERRRAARQQGM